ncbi:MAG: YqeG family HAD IIIA-type phosphatase [Clostridia bacterium]|nr:YqeG family HAD IIIA-type phosphatase [Clostridia bacterium]
MEKFLVPDRMFDTVFEITPDFLKAHGVFALLCDIDNTLSPYEDAVPDAAVCNWIAKMRESGVEIALISNNSEARVATYNKDLHLAAFADAHKPSVTVYRQASAALGVPLKKCAVLGDQLLTDALAAWRLKIPAFIVPPIKDKTTLFFRAKRAVEVPFIRAYKRQNQR